jgi:hypothetical protein
LNPFIYGTASNLKCFDEASPCLLEQYSICVVENYDQSKYVPWLVCMDSNGDPEEQCDSQVGISDSDVQACLADNSALIDKYLQIDSPIGGTPTVYVNGANVKTTYSAISKALCAADPSLSGCSAVAPLDAEREIQTFNTREVVA